MQAGGGVLGELDDGRCINEDEAAERAGRQEENRSSHGGGWVLGRGQYLVEKG